MNKDPPLVHSWSNPLKCRLTPEGSRLAEELHRDAHEREKHNSRCRCVADTPSASSRFDPPRPPETPVRHFLPACHGSASWTPAAESPGVAPGISRLPWPHLLTQKLEAVENGPERSVPEVCQWQGRSLSAVRLPPGCAPGTHGSTASPQPSAEP